MSDRQLPQGVTPEQVQELVRKHGKVYPVYVNKDGRIIAGLFKKPTLVIMSAAASAGVNNPLRSSEVLYNSCKLHVDAEMDEDEEVKASAFNQVSKLFRILEGEVGEPFAGG